jgi:hypothetical protein
MALNAIPDDAVTAPVGQTPEDDADFERRLKALSQKAGG